MRPEKVFQALANALPRAAALPALLAAGACIAQPSPIGKLEIHYINVEQGGSTMIVGPNGTRIMYDFGNFAGGKYLLPYLKNKLEMTRGDKVQYAIVSHGDRDHYTGYKEFVGPNGFDITVANYEPGTTKTVTPTMHPNWLEPAKKTTAKAFKPIPVGLRIALGDGAEAHVVAANGVVVGDPFKPVIKNENDCSVALFIRYGKFRYIIDGDLGAGREPCTGHETDQLDVQSRVADALVKNDLMAKDAGVDVLHIAHHGSESSTSAAYFNRMKPTVAIISVGDKQGTFLHPREDVVDKVLLQLTKVTCVKAVAVKAVLQTSAGPPRGCSSTGCMSFKGTPLGNIVITTDGKSGYDIEAERSPDPATAARMGMPAAYPWHFGFK